MFGKHGTTKLLGFSIVVVGTFILSGCLEGDNGTQGPAGPEGPQGPAGSVTQIDTGLGLTGGLITTTGTINLKLSAAGGLDNMWGASSDELGIIPGSVDGQILRWDNSAVMWVLDLESTNADTLDSLDSTAFALMTHNHDADYVNLNGDTMTGLLTLSGDPTVSLHATTKQYVDMANATQDAVIATSWQTGGNAGLIDGTDNILGTTDNVALEFVVNNARALRIEPPTLVGAAPNIIGGHPLNSVTFPFFVGATISGGGFNDGTDLWENRVTASYGTISGGNNNTADFYATVGGGQGNTASAGGSAVGGGYGNTASGGSSAVGGGSANTASGSRATVGGGISNMASDARSTVSGGSANIASGGNSTVGGGYVNTASGWYSNVGGGQWNTAGGWSSTVGGGERNQAQALYATIAGGGPTDLTDDTTKDNTNNRVFDVYGTIGGGGENRAGSDDADTTTATFATVSGGAINKALAIYATVGGGSRNTASGVLSTVSGGFNNDASGLLATVPGGFWNLAAGSFSFAAGIGANVAAADNGAFIWADDVNSGIELFFNSAVPNEFAARATGGFRFVTAVDAGGAPTAGLAIPAGTNSLQAFGAGNLTLGNTTVSGTLSIPTGASAGYVLTSNVSGDATWQPVPGGPGPLWIRTGNSLLTDGVDNLLGTTDMVAINIMVNNERALRIEPTATGDAPNIIGGHPANTVTGGVVGATISGGGQAAWANQVTANYGTVGGGRYNTANGIASTVGGGWNNTASAIYATVGGGQNNSAIDWNATVSGGNGNAASFPSSTVGGGSANVASGPGATVGGGEGNTANGISSTIGGGQNNIAIGQDSTVGGGRDNTASGGDVTVGGGRANTVSGDDSTISGGVSNTASGRRTTVGGGFVNTAMLDYATVGGGFLNTASGYAATVPGGRLNIAAGDYSFAAGRRAIIDTLHDGAFLFADETNLDFDSTAANEFAARATGGVRFVTKIDGAGAPTQTTQINLADGTWQVVSDRNRKKNFEKLDGGELLGKIARMPVTMWNYKWEDDDDVPHIGPVAQDFKALFYPGRDDKTISTLEFDGVAFAAIKALEKRTAQLQHENAAQQQENAALIRRIARLEEALEKWHSKAGND